MREPTKKLFSALFVEEWHMQLVKPFTGNVSNSH